MASLRWHPTTLLVTLVLVCGVAERDLRQTYRAPSVQPEITDEEVWHHCIRDILYIRHIHSMINAYRGDVGGRLIIETNALIDTKYRTWKRNADMINSLLALPKGLNDAGR